MNASSAPKTQGAGRLYLRLIGYAWHYKTRLGAALFFAIIVAICSGSMIFSVGGIARIIFAKEEMIRFTAPTTTVSTILDALKNQPEVTGAPVLRAEGDQTTFEVPITPQGANGSQKLQEQLSQLGAGDIDALPEKVHETLKNIQTWRLELKNRIGWDPQGIEDLLRKTVLNMRTHRMLALEILSAVLILLTLIGGIARFFQEYIAGSISANITVDLMQQMYRSVIELPLTFFERRPTGELIARFTNDVFTVNHGLAGVFVKLFREPFKAIVFLTLALSIDPLLTLVGICVLPPAGYVLIAIGKRIRKYVRRYLERIANFASVAKETFTGILIVKAFRMERHHTARAESQLTNLRRYLMKVLKADAAAGPLSEFVMVLGVVTFMLLSGKRVESGQMDSGDLVVLYGALFAMLDPLRKLATVNNNIQTSIASAQRVFDFIDAKPAIIESPNATPLPRLSKALQFQNISFTYPDTQAEVLHDISFEMPQGHMTALVGFSGSGKTTIAKLLPRFYDPTTGAILLDGNDLRNATLASLRDQIGFVSQDTLLFDETVRENIAGGREGIPDQQIENAARIAQAHEFIMALPQGYETRIGESGATLSGGQRQRLAIARALACDPAILILDEATSNLDSESEQAIQHAIEQSIIGRTTLIIAHRLSTILRANQILVIDQGHIAEQGTHAQLIEQNGLYRRLYEIQFGADKA